MKKVQILKPLLASFSKATVIIKDKLHVIMVISTPAAPPHVVPHRIGGKWEGDVLPAAGDRPASELRPQCRFTI